MQVQCPVITILESFSTAVHAVCGSLFSCCEGVFFGVNKQTFSFDHRKGLETGTFHTNYHIQSILEPKPYIVETEAT